MHISITHVYICPKTGSSARKMAIFIICQNRQTEVAADAVPRPYGMPMAITIH